MKSDGKVSFDQGVVVNNEDPKKLGRVKVRMLSDGIDTPDTMHKGDDELHWYEPCILGAGYEVGSLTIPPVGSFLWCLECEFNTENVFRVYLGSSYGTGPSNTKQFNAMETPPEVIETPSEALISYPYNQLLYKSTQGSYINFYGDKLAGFDLCTGIPIRDKNGNANTDNDTNYTYNSFYGDRESLWMEVSEMPNPIDKDNPKEPEDIPISYIRASAEDIFAGVVRDRGSDLFNHQIIDSSGIQMKVRGQGGLSSPSENKELEDKLNKEISTTDKKVEKASEKATKSVSKDNGVLDNKTKIDNNTIEQITNQATSSIAKMDAKKAGMTKKEFSLFEYRFNEVVTKVPGGRNFIRAAMSNAIQGNFKAISYHVLSEVSAIGFSLISGLFRDKFSELINNKNIVDTEEASRYVKKIIGEANINTLTGKASNIINMIGGKLGPFGDIFKRVANTALSMVTSKVGFINQATNKLAGMSELLSIIDRLKLDMTPMIIKEVEASTKSSGDVVIDAIKRSVVLDKPVDISSIGNWAIQDLSNILGVPVSEFKFGDKEAISSNRSNAKSNLLANNEYSFTNSENSSSKEFTSEDEETIRILAKIVNNTAKSTLSDSVESVLSTVLSKTLATTVNEVKVDVEAEEEYENKFLLDADGCRVLVPGEELDNYCSINNDCIEAHAGEYCLFQMNNSNITNFISDPEFENQSTITMASNGVITEVDNGLTDSTTITTEASKVTTEVSNSISSSNIEQTSDKISFNVNNKSTIEMTENNIVLNIGRSKIEMLPDEIKITSSTVINIGAINVNIGQGVNLGYYNGEPFHDGICKFGVKNLQSVVDTTWNLDGYTMNFK